jgi:hypothetical protein
MIDHLSTRQPKTEGGFSTADHFLVAGASFRIAQIQSSSSSDAVVRICAYDADNDTSMSGDNGDVAVTLELDGLTVRNAAGAIIHLGTGGVQAYLVDSSIVVDGVKEGYTIEVKSDTPYDCLEITNADGLDHDHNIRSPDLNGRSLEISTISAIQTANARMSACIMIPCCGTGANDVVVSSDGIDLSLLGGAAPIACGVTDMAASSASHETSALSVYQDVVDQDGDGPTLFAAASLADQDQGQRRGMGRHPR